MIKSFCEIQSFCENFFIGKKVCTAAGETSPSLVEQWNYIEGVVRVLIVSASYKYICDDTGLTPVQGLGFSPFTLGLSISHTPLPQRFLETQRRFKQEK